MNEIPSSLPSPEATDPAVLGFEMAASSDEVLTQLESDIRILQLDEAWYGHQGDQQATTDITRQKIALEAQARARRTTLADVWARSSNNLQLFPYNLRIEDVEQELHTATAERHAELVDMLKSLKDERDDLVRNLGRDS